MALYTLCSPVLVPQITGALEAPPGLVTVKVSVKHWLEVLAPFPPALMAPFKTFTVVVVNVLGPVMVKVLKSSLS